MDYDDTDFQGHNHHLAEGSSKLSPVLHPYALPKFDFDDSLQGHLRFDSLVENEVFLGIPSQEDNQWIEDFSRGSSGIEFSSSATESCSISRRNNVWSEATSSESVEMLLKSVGQEEKILGELINGESDAGDELGRLTLEMEPNSKQDDKMENAIHTQSELAPFDFPDGWNQSAGAEHSNVGYTSEALKDDSPVCGSSGEVDAKVFSGVIVSKGDVGTDRKCDDANQMEVENSVMESIVDNMKEPPSVSGNTSSSPHNDIAKSGEFNDQENKHHVTDVSSENVGVLLKEISTGMVEHDVWSKHSNMDDQIVSATTDGTCTKKLEDPHHVASRVDSLVDQKVEVITTTFEEPSGSPMKEGRGLQIADGCKNDVCSAEPSQHYNFEVVMCTEGPEICKQFQGSLNEDSQVVCLGDGSPMDQAIEFGNTKAGTSACPELACPELEMAVEEKEKDLGNVHEMISLQGQNAEVGTIKAGSSSCPKLEMVSAVDKEKSSGSDYGMDRRAFAEASVLPAVGHKLVEMGDGSAINHVGGFSGWTIACSSAELIREQSSNETLTSGSNTPRVLKEDFIAEGLISPLIIGGCTQLNGKNLFSEDAHRCDQDVSFNERGNAELPSESSNMECTIVGSLCSDECKEGKIVIAHGSELEGPKGNEPESKVVVEDTNLSSCDTLNGWTGASADEVTSHNRGQKLPVLGMVSMDTDETEEEDTEVHKDASKSGLKESVLVASDLEPLPEAAKASQCHHEAVDVGQECSKKLEACPVLFDLPVKQVEDSEAARCENDKEILMERNGELASREVAEAVQLSNKIVIPAEAISVSMTEPCCDMSQESNEVLEASGSQTTEQTGPSTKVDSSDDHRAAVVLACPSEHVANCSNEDGDGSVNLVKGNCESSSIFSCTELPLSEKGQKVGIKWTIVDNVPHSGGTCDADGKVKSVSLPAGKDSSFAVEVSPFGGLSEGQTSKDWQSFPSVQVHKISMDVEGPPFTSGLTQIDLKMVPEISHGSPQPSARGMAHTGAKRTPERKTRRGSGKATARESVKKGNHVKETTPVRQSERGDKSMMFMRSPGTGQLMQFEELKPCGDVERSGTKPCGVLPIPTSNLPDLNTSVSPVAFFQQPFTDIQQVQLRAQIFVYGSLIQESIPDEACMVSAFGPSDGGGSLWQPAWRACVERVHAPSSHTSSGTPVQSGSKAADQPAKHSSLQSKVLSSPAGRSKSKGTQSLVNPIIPLSSPLWNVSTPSCEGLQSSGIPRGAPVDFQQSISPLHPYQVPGIRNFVGHSPSWLSQTPFPGPWVTSPQTSAFDANACYSVFPNTEPVKLTPAKDSAVPNFPATKHASLLAVANGGGGAGVSSGTSSQPDVKKVTVPTGLRSSDLKPRKRKKVPVTEGPSQIPLPALHQAASVCSPSVSNHLPVNAFVPEVVDQKSLLAQNQTELVPTAVASNLFSTSVAVTTPLRFASTSNSGKFLAAVSPTSVSDQPERVTQKLEKKSIISDETLNTVEEAKLQAEATAVHAAATVGHCHDVWSQLGKQQSSGLISDVEAKLASAAMTITAAASVAKAAAAAAKIASNVAVQAKLMADEVSALSVSGISTQSTGISLSHISNGSGNAIPSSSSILKVGDGNTYPSSIIAVAREAARKRVEAASAASRHAENLDAIVKAAELASEAVSQAGKIVSIGDTLPLSELVELGPVGYWKNPLVSPEQGAKLHIVDCDKPKAVSVELHNVAAEQSNGGPSCMEEAKKLGMTFCREKISTGLMGGHLVVDGISGTVTSIQKDSSRAQRGRRASELAKTIGIVPESEAGSRSGSVIGEDVYTSASRATIENRMKEGCFVEVFKDGDNYKAAWYLANILNLKDGKALICYTDLQEDEGSGKLKEWVPLEGDGIKAPTMRIAHRTSTMHFDGTRKRRRAAVMEHNWSVGDKVDAWMQDCWREGIVKEKNKNDETTLTICFPALGDTSVVRAWHLRPTLTWQDGEWIEWSGARQRFPSQGDEPQQKRAKLGSPAMEAKGKDKIPSGIDLVESRKDEESRLLPLSASEKEFNVGKNTRHDNKLDAQRTRTDLQKEGSRVVFGVPKPGKKRKFMDVSKHFDSDQSSKNVKTNDSVKFARYLVPQGSGSCGWKNSTKIDVKEKQAPVDKSKIIRSGKPPSVSGRALPQNDNLTSAKSAPHDASMTDQIPEDSISNEENNAGQENLVEFGSFSNSQDTSEGSTLISSLSLPQVAPKKLPLSNAKSERLNKGKVAPAVVRLGKKVELQDKSIPEVVEPRRSNRKIQPTSRLLEGLQSSLIISKIPSFPHDKSQRNQNRSNFKREH